MIIVIIYFDIIPYYFPDRLYVPRVASLRELEDEERAVDSKFKIVLYISHNTDSKAFTGDIVVFCVSFNSLKGNSRSGPTVIKLLSSSAQLSMKFQLLINAEIVKNHAKFRFKTKKTSM